MSLSPSSTGPRRRDPAALLLALSAPAFGGAALAQSTPPSTSALPREVRIGFQMGSAVLVLARKQQVVEKRLKALGVPGVKWVEFQFGPPMLEALGAGAIDLGSVGDTIASRDFATRHPATLAAEATGIDVKSWSTAFARAEFSFGPITDAHVAQQQQLADTFQSLGIIPRKINVRDIVWRSPDAR